MKRCLTAVAILLSAGAFAAAPKNVAPAASKAVMPAPKRLEALKSAAEILAPAKTTWRTVVTDLPDPFYRSNFTRSREKTPQPGEPGSAQPMDLDALERVATQIQPTGTMLIGNEPYLLIGGRRYKVGDQIAVTYEGLVYQVSISSIERNQYTLRLNDHELRREFK
jgi:hypothetical protein